jgi:hypothetical protein
MWRCFLAHQSCKGFDAFVKIVPIGIEPLDEGSCVLTFVACRATRTK